jgi:hypothetical protein
MQLLNRLTLWSRVLLDKLTVIQPNSVSSKCFGSSQCSKESDTDPYSNHHFSTLFLYDPFPYYPLPMFSKSSVSLKLYDKV